MTPEQPALEGERVPDGRQSPDADRRGAVIPARNAADFAALAALLAVGLFFLSGLGLSGGYRIYMGVVVATWAILFAAAIGQARCPP
jgi:hypothetical protein